MFLSVTTKNLDWEILRILLLLKDGMGLIRMKKRGHKRTIYICRRDCLKIRACAYDSATCNKESMQNYK